MAVTTRGEGRKEGSKYAPLDAGGIHLVEEADLVPVDDEVLVVEVHRALIHPVHLLGGRRLDRGVGMHQGSPQQRGPRPADV